MHPVMLCSRQKSVGRCWAAASEMHQSWTGSLHMPNNGRRVGRKQKIVIRTHIRLWCMDSQSEVKSKILDLNASPPLLLVTSSLTRPLTIRFQAPQYLAHFASLFVRDLPVHNWLTNAFVFDIVTHSYCAWLWKNAVLTWPTLEHQHHCP